MRAVVQRTSRAEVRVDGKVTGSIGKGVMILLGIEADDTQEDIEWLCSRYAACGYSQIWKA
jgi:D-tyrosyl-tRNA(Tyr) deacylase